MTYHVGAPLEGCVFEYVRLLGEDISEHNQIMRENQLDDDCDLGEIRIGWHVFFEPHTHNEYRDLPLIPWMNCQVDGVGGGSRECL